MSDKAKFSHSDFSNDKKLSIGINAKKNSNLQEWLDALYLLAKKHFGVYAQAIKDRKIPKEWTDKYVPTENEIKAAAEDEFTKKGQSPGKLTRRLDQLQVIHGRIYS